MTRRSDEDDLPGERAAPRTSPIRRGLWLVIAVLAGTALLLTAREQLPAAPLLILVMAGLGAGLWWLADRGGRQRDRPVAAPIEAIGLLAAVVAAIGVFWVMFDWLD